MASSDTIDYWGIVVRSLRHVWRNKPLWFFGFFAASGGGGSLMNWTEKTGPSVGGFLKTHLEVLAVLVLFVIVLWLVFFIMSLISRGALIWASGTADEGHRVPFADAWSKGLSAFWKMLLLLIIAVVVFLAVTIICAVPIVLPLAGGAAGITISIIVAAVLFLPFLAFLFLLAFTITYAEREAVVQGSDILASLRVGWQLTREHFWKSVLIWLVQLLCGLLFVIGFFVVGAMIAVPFVVIWTANHLAALLLGIPVGVVYFCVASGAYGAFEYSFWTAAYREIRKLGVGSGEIALG